jgi:hypothetical protein
MPQQRGAASWKETARAREGIILFLETALPHTSRTRKGIVLQGKQILLVQEESLWS